MYMYCNYKRTRADGKEKKIIILLSLPSFLTLLYFFLPFEQVTGDKAETNQHHLEHSYKIMYSITGRFPLTTCLDSTSTCLKFWLVKSNKTHQKFVKG